MTQIFHRVRRHGTNSRIIESVYDHSYMIVADDNFRSIRPKTLIDAFDTLGIAYIQKDQIFFLKEEDVNLIRLMTKPFETIGTIIYFTNVVILDIIQLSD